MGGLADNPQNRLLLSNLTKQRWSRVIEGTRYGYALLARKVLRSEGINLIEHLDIDPEEYLQQDHSQRSGENSQGSSDKIIASRDRKISQLREERNNVTEELDQVKKEMAKTQRDNEQLKRRCTRISEKLDVEKQERQAETQALERKLEALKIDHEAKFREKDRAIEELNQRVIFLEERQKVIDELGEYVRGSQTAVDNLNQTLPGLLKIAPDLAILKEVVPTLINLVQAQQ